LNKEEDIKIISAVELTSEEKEKVVASVKKSRPQSRFKVSYAVEPAILGGLQVFAGS
jgi:F0F1-type ATP synthase delta subunit